MLQSQISDLRRQKKKADDEIKIRVKDVEELRGEKERLTQRLKMFTVCFPPVYNFSAYIEDFKFELYP